MAYQAERVVVAIEAQTANAVAELSRAERSATNALRKIGAEAINTEKSVGAATRNLGFQVIDVGTQLAGGTSPLLILAQQGPQAAQAIEMATAAGASFGTVMKGLALPAVISIASALLGLAASHSKSTDATEEHKQATKSLRDALDDLAKANDAALNSGQRHLYMTQAAANATLAEAAATRELIKAKIESRIQDIEAQRARSQGPGQRGELGTLALTESQRQLEQLRANLAAQDRLVTAAQREVRRAGGAVSKQLVEEQFDASARAAGRFQRASDLLDSQLAKGTITVAQHRARLADLTAERDRATKAAKQHHTAATGLADAQALLLSADNDVQRAEANLRIEREKARAELKAGKITQDEYTARVAAAIDVVQAAKLSQNQFRESLQGTITTGFDLIDMLKRLQDEGDRRFASLFAPEMDQLKKLSSFDAEHEQNKQIFSEQERMRQEQQRKSEENIRDLASLYEDLFRGGADAIWGDFKAIGLRVIAELLAKWTIARLGGDVSGFQGGGGFVGSLVTSLSSVFGMASGGYAAPGSLHRVNEHAGGVELLRMGPQGGQVIPLGQARATAPAAQRIELVVHAEEGRMFRPVVRQISSEAARPVAISIVQSAAPAIARAGADSAIQRQAKARRFGGTSA